MIKMSYTHRFIALAISLFVAFNFQSTAVSDVVLHTCNNAAASSRNIQVDFCLRSLSEDPASETADLFGLGKITIDLIGRNATGTLQYIERLLTQNLSEDWYVRPRLRDCQDLYSDAVATVRDAAAEYASKRYFDANFALSSVMDAATTCEDGFKEIEGIDSPLTKSNGDAFELTAIGLSILRMLS